MSARVWQTRRLRGAARCEAYGCIPVDLTTGKRRLAYLWCPRCGRQRVGVKSQHTRTATRRFYARTS